MACNQAGAFFFITLSTSSPFKKIKYCIGSLEKMTKTLRTVLILPVNELPWPGYVIHSHAQDHKYACHIGKTVPRDNHVKYWVLSGLFLKQQYCVSVYTKIHFVVLLLLLLLSNSASNFKYWVLSGLFLKQQYCVSVYTKIHFVVLLLLLLLSNSASNFQSVFTSCFI